MNTSLFVLADEYLAAAEHMADLELDDQTIADTLEGLAGSLEVKATNVAMFVRNLDASAEAIKDAEAQMAMRRKAIENRAARIRQYLLDNMERTGISKIECPYFKIAVRENPPSVLVSDEREIPPRYFKTPPPPLPVLDKKAVAEAIRAGEDVPGARLVRGKRLEIR